jgi:ferrochelatase
MERKAVRRGVLLFNLGGPERLQDVRPFLYNLFSDPEIIRIKNNALRSLLALFLSSIRQGKSRDLYRQIGGGSPLRKITEAQAEALGSRLSARGFPTRVYVGMRCWKPSIDEAVDCILRDQITHLVLLPLFPQYSVTTTGSCLKHFQSLDRKHELSEQMEISVIRNWFDEPLYVESMTDLIWEGLQAFSKKEGVSTHLLYSAHSIPTRYVEEGDPYLEQTRQSVELIHARLGREYPYSLGFQSKVGPVKWLIPGTKDVLAELGRKGTSRVLVVPVSFVSDHIETLQEIDIAYKDFAARWGIGEFHRAPAPNLHPKFIDALAELAIREF